MSLGFVTLKDGLLERVELKQMMRLSWYAGNYGCSDPVKIDDNVCRIDRFISAAQPSQACPLGRNCKRNENGIMLVKRGLTLDSCVETVESILKEYNINPGEIYVGASFAAYVYRGWLPPRPCMQRQVGIRLEPVADQVVASPRQLWLDRLPVET